MKKFGLYKWTEWLRTQIGMNSSGWARKKEAKKEAKKERVVLQRVLETVELGKSSKTCMCSNVLNEKKKSK